MPASTLTCYKTEGHEDECHFVIRVPFCGNPLPPLEPHRCMKTTQTVREAHEPKLKGIKVDMSRAMRNQPLDDIKARPADPSAKCRCCEYQDPESEKAKNCHCKEAVEAGPHPWVKAMREAGRRLARQKEQEVIDELYGQSD